MTLDGLVGMVRDILKDVTATYRWSDAYILTALCIAIRHLQGVRPESRYVDGVLTKTEFPTINTASGADNSTAKAWEVPVDERWHEGIVFYALGRCYEIDSSDTANQALSAGFYQKADARFMQ